MVIRDAIQSGGWIPAGGKPQAAAPFQDPVEERMHALEDENDRLRAEVARLKRNQPSEAGPSVHFSVQQNQVEIKHLPIAGMQIEALTARFAPGVDLLGEFTLEKILAEPGSLIQPSFDPLQDSPIQVEHVKMSIPAKVANDAARLRGGKMLRDEGINELAIAFQPGGRIQASGTLDKLIPVPFRVAGKLSLTRDKKIMFEPEKVRVMGLPMPRLTLAIANAIAGDQLKKLDIQTRDERLIIDPKSFLPPNVQLQLTRITTEGDRLVLEGGPPPPAPPPRTLTA